MRVGGEIGQQTEEKSTIKPVLQECALTAVMLLERTSIESQQSHLVELRIKANSYSNSSLPA